MSEQPAPRPGRVDVTPVARIMFEAMLRERDAQGRRTYATSLQTHNGRDAFQDAMEEAVDLWQYLVQARLEYDDLKNEVDRLRALVIALGGEP